MPKTVFPNVGMKTTWFRFRAGSRIERIDPIA
jgi:hypothetical protein